MDDPCDRKDTFSLCCFETTRTCNLACKCCMSRKAEPPERKELEALDTLDTDQAKFLVLDELAKVSSNVAVAFSGGEHLLRADAYELPAHAASLGMWSFAAVVAERALVSYTTGDILAEDPACFLEPEGPDDRSELEELQTARLGKFVEHLKYNRPWNELFWST